jgi:hypothetical protein
MTAEWLKRAFSSFWGMLPQEEKEKCLQWIMREIERRIQNELGLDVRTTGGAVVGGEGTEEGKGRSGRDTTSKNAGERRGDRAL